MNKKSSPNKNSLARIAMFFINLFPINGRL